MLGRRPNLVLSALVLGVFTEASASQGDLLTFLPPERVVNPWKVSGEPLRFTADTLHEFINGGAELFLEYGFLRLVSQEYLRGEDSIVCNVYEMKGPEAAFGIFSYSRGPGKPPLALGDGGFNGGLQIGFWQDRYFAVLEGYSADPDLNENLLSFGRSISERIGAHAAEPAILGRLPLRHLIPHSARLLRGRLALDSFSFLGETDLLDLDEEDVVLSAEYRARDAAGTTRLFLVLFRRPQQPGRAYQSLSRALTGESGYQSLGERETERSWVKEGRYFLLRQEHDSLTLVADAPSLGEAEALLGREPREP